MCRDIDEQVVAEARLAVVLGRCWWISLLLAAGRDHDAFVELAAVMDWLPLRDGHWC